MAKIEITAVAGTTSLTIAVADTGNGMPPESINAIQDNETVIPLIDTENLKGNGLAAIKTILNDKPYYFNEVAVKLIENEKIKPVADNKFGLSESELLILKMIAHEMSNDEIAVSLNITKRTVDFHRQHLLLKLNAKNTAGLVKAAYLLKLI